MMDPNKTYTKPAVEVEAQQFRGWVDAAMILDWMRAPAYFVPEGFDHPKRKSTEYNSDGLKPDAPSYLVYLSESGSWVRVEEEYWIVRDVDGTLKYYTPETFAKSYAKKGV